jgi:hypothetical protein
VVFNRIHTMEEWCESPMFKGPEIIWHLLRMRNLINVGNWRGGSYLFQNLLNIRIQSVKKNLWI